MIDRVEVHKTSNPYRCSVRDARAILELRILLRHHLQSSNSAQEAEGRVSCHREAEARIRCIRNGPRKSLRNQLHGICGGVRAGGSLDSIDLDPLPFRKKSAVERGQVQPSQL